VHDYIFATLLHLLQIIVDVHDYNHVHDYIFAMLLHLLQIIVGIHDYIFATFATDNSWYT
jgi:hypothetical protein